MVYDFTGRLFEEACKGWWILYFHKPFPEIEDQTPRRHPAKPTQGRAGTRTTHAETDEGRAGTTRTPLFQRSLPRNDEGSARPRPTPKKIRRQIHKVLRANRPHRAKSFTRPDHIREKSRRCESPSYGCRKLPEKKILAVGQQKCKKLEENDLDPSLVGQRRV